MSWTGPLGESLAWADRALTVLSGEPGEGAGLVGYSLLVRALIFRAMVLLRMGRLAEARSDAARALAVGRPRAEPENLVSNLAVLSETAWVAGEDDDTLALAAEAVRVGEDNGRLIPPTTIDSWAVSSGGEHFLDASPGVNAVVWARNRRSGASEIREFCDVNALVSRRRVGGSGQAPVPSPRG